MFAQFEEGYATDEPLHLVSSISKNCAHYIEIFSRAIDKVIPPETLENTWVPRAALHCTLARSEY